MPNQNQNQQVKNEQRNNGERSMIVSNIRAIKNDNGKTVYRLSFSSEEPYTRWWGVEILSHAEDAVDLTRLNSIGCALFNHDSNKVIGKVNKAWLENNRGEAEIEFDDDEFSQMIKNKVDKGSLKGVSVGYHVFNWEEVSAGKQSTDGRFTGECSIATRWEPLEISIVSVPADATVGVGRSFDENAATEQHTVIDKGVSSFLYEKQLQINLNNLKGGIKS